MSIEIQGTFDPKFAAVAERFANNFAEFPEVGACFAASINGEMVIDIWAGHHDREKTQPWQQDTLCNVWSVSKTMTFLVVLMLADKGELSLDAAVADYWPEFAQQGKGNITIAELLSHCAGLPGWSERTPISDIYDWNATVEMFAAAKPWWDLSVKQSGYHPVSQGFLIGEVVRRVTGQTIGEYFRQQVAEPLAVDFHIGTPASEFGRISALHLPEDPREMAGLFDLNSMATPVFGNMFAGPKQAMTADWLKAEVPAANGQGNARSIVRAQTALANQGHAFGRDLLSPEMVKRAAESQIDGIDLVLGLPVNFCMGYAKPNASMPHSPNEDALFWCGAGGSSIVIDADQRLCFSYVMNRMLPSVVGEARSYGLSKAIYSCL